LLLLNLLRAIPKSFFKPILYPSLQPYLVLINIIEESAGDCQKANEAEMTAKCSLNLLNFVSGKVLTHQNDFSASYRKR
jgi:hypothetical protein